MEFYQKSGKMHMLHQHKKGENALQAYESHISYLQTLGKLIRNAIIDRMEKNSLFNKSQHGFMKTRSCMTQLLETLEELT